ncbi:MAG: DUF2809 domain-containing protein [Hyphomonadaceae bacterium]|nr:DUF2809 domain-containing protein [Hyphomonadaceae bacterium]
MQRRAAYGIAALILLVVEVLIALFVNDQFVRPYLGDVLAVVLVYASLRAVTPMGFTPALCIALGIALVIEVAQALNLLGALGLADNQFARIVLGGAFDMLDMAAYLAGGIAVLAVESGSRRAGRGLGL